MNIQTANRLVSLRREHGLSQEQLAEKLGISRQAVSKWERAESSPDTDNLIALARLYQISLDHLLEMDASPEEGPEEAPEAGEDLGRAEGEAPEAEYAFVQPEVQYALEMDEDEEGQEPVREAYVDGEVGPVEEAPHGFHWQTFPYPVLVTILFLAAGFLFGMWHPAWMLFLTVPIYYTSIQDRGFDLGNVPYPVVVTLIYLLIGFFWSMWHPGWLLFLTVPIYYWADSTFPRFRTVRPMMLAALVLMVVLGKAMGGGRMIWFVLIAAALCVLLVYRKPEDESGG